MAAIVGGGRGAKPGEISLAHNGVLFLDEFPEFPRTVLDTLRQPIETGTVVVARANAHIRYPCRFLLIAAANPCKCGYLSDPNRACGRAPICGEDYLGRISGPLMDRFDLRVEVPPVAFTDLDLPASGDASTSHRRPSLHRARPPVHPLCRPPGPAGERRPRRRVAGRTGHSRFRRQGPDLPRRRTDGPLGARLPPHPARRPHHRRPRRLRRPSANPTSPRRSASACHPPSAEFRVQLARPMSLWAEHAAHNHPGRRSAPSPIPKVRPPPAKPRRQG